MHSLAHTTCTTQLTYRHAHCFAHRVCVQRCSPESRCIGGQFSLCSPEFDGPYCSQCAPSHYSQGFLCLPCIEGSAQKRTIIIVSFIIIFNSMLLFANYEVSVTLLGVSSTALH
jgi:hypothetical protein